MNAILISILTALTIFFIVQIRHSLKRSSKNVELIEKYIDHLKNPARVENLIDELPALITKYKFDILSISIEYPFFIS